MELPGIADQRFGPPLSWRLLEDQLNQMGPGGPPREAQLKRSVLDSLFQPSTRFKPGIAVVRSADDPGPPQGPILLGWLDESPPDVRVAGRTPVQQTTALLYAPLSYRLPDEGDVSLPPGLVPGALVEMPLEGGPCGPDATSVHINRGQAVFEFQVPDEVRDVRVDALKLVFGTDGSWWQPPDTAIYDWDAEAWAELDGPVMGVNVLSDTTGLVSDDGLVRVRLSSEGGGGGCIYLELGLEGTR